jgi:ATP-dependent protease ClpP protease subunit
MGASSVSIFEKDYVREQATGITSHFYIHGQIEGSEDYVELLHTLYNATDRDIIILHLNTPGGYLDTAVEIIHAIAQCEGHVVGSADGLVASAGSLIFFACHQFILGEFCEVMLHDGSGGSYGKFNENLKSAEFTSKRLSHIYHTVYGRFLDEETVQGVLDGKDLYLTATDVEKLIDKAIEQGENEGD